jgi:hypothetical protein
MDTWNGGATEGTLKMAHNTRNMRSTSFPRERAVVGYGCRRSSNSMGNVPVQRSSVSRGYGTDSARGQWPLCFPACNNNSFATSPNLLKRDQDLGHTPGLPSRHFGDLACDLGDLLSESPIPFLLAAMFSPVWLLAISCQNPGNINYTGSHKRSQGWFQLVALLRSLGEDVAIASRGCCERVEGML